MSVRSAIVSKKGNPAASSDYDNIVAAIGSFLLLQHQPNGFEQRGKPLLLEAIHDSNSARWYHDDTDEENP